MSEEKGKELGTIVSVHDMESPDRGVLAVIMSPSGKPVEVTGDVDEAMKLAIHNKDYAQLDEVTSKRILKKIDMYLLPVMCMLYCFQFMDKLSNSYASVLGLRTDLGMIHDMYSWTGTAFYLGYLAFEFPASYLLQRFPVAKTVACFILVWGIILCLHSVPQYAGFIALRTILGMLESAVTPAFTIITSQWYTQEEQFLRVSIWFAFNGLGNILGGSISYGLAVHAESYTIEAWKLVFIITGCLTIFLSFVIFIHLPDSPSLAWFLSEEEKYLVVERIRKNQQGFGNKHFKKHQFIEAMKDYKTWLLFFFAIANNIPNGGITNFGSILLTTDLGYSAKEALLMQMPGGAVEIVGCIGMAYLSKYLKSRMIIAMIATLIIIMAECFLAFSTKHKLQMAGYALTNILPVGLICMLSVVASNVAGHTKKVTTNAILLIGYCVGNLVGPQTFIDTQAPKYQGAKVAMLICSCIQLCMIGGIYASYRWENSKRDKLDLSTFDDFENSEFADLTDGQNPRFRYAL